MISMDLREIVKEIAPSIVVLKETVADAQKVLDESFDLAFLDTGLANGKSSDMASRLIKKRRPVRLSFGHRGTSFPIL